MPANRPSSPAPRPWDRITVATGIAEVEGAWRALEAGGLLTPYQSHGWIAAYAATVAAAEGMELRYALVADRSGAPLALLPLVLTRRSLCRFAEFVGGKHANYHMGLFRRDFARALDRDGAKALLDAVAAAIGGLDAFVFVNQPHEWNGLPNPLAALASGPSPSAVYKLAIQAGDGDAALKRAMSPHAQKKLKNKRKRLDGLGPWRVIHARVQDEVTRVLDAFLIQKAQRFREMGVPDPFATPGVRDFLETGALGSGSTPPPFELYGLERAGHLVATYVGTVQGERFSGMATSFDMADESARFSPGETLLVELIRLKAAQGIAVFDLGVGEARYKTTICDARDELVDSFLPLSARGRVFARAARARRAAKRRIKASPWALRLAQRVSGLLRRRAPAQDED